MSNLAKNNSKTDDDDEFSLNVVEERHLIRVRELLLWNLKSFLVLWQIVNTWRKFDSSVVFYL